MRSKLVVATLAAALVAGAASAADVTPGLQQIANELGVDAGAYSSGELAQLLSARRDGDQNTYAWLLQHGAARSAVATSAGKAQIAAQLGLDPAQFTTAELTQILEAKRTGDQQALNFYLKHENRNDYYHPQPQIGRDS